MMKLDTPLCVALDQRDPDEVTRIAAAVEAHVGLFKVGLTAFISFGSYLTRSLAEQKPVFLDLKLHDIPAQVEGAIASVAGSGASLVTVHAAGGAEMIKAATAAAGDEVGVLAVTILTSLDDQALGSIGMRGPAADAVLRLADIAMAAGARGLVCSPLEVRSLRERFGGSDTGGPLLVVPGIRPAGSRSGDQKRTLTPREALEGGADVIVVGRPITSAADPAAAAEAILTGAGPG